MRGVATSRSTATGGSARLVADHAAIGGGPDHRSAGLRAEGERHMVVGHGGGRSARRATRRVHGIVRVHRRAGMPVGEFRGHGLAHDHAVGRARQRHAGCVGERHLAREDGRIVTRRHVVGVDDVLHADRHAADQPRRCLVRRARLGERQLRIEMGPGMEDRLACPDAIEAGAHQRLRRQHAGSNRRGRLGGGQQAGFDFAHDSTLCAQAATSSRRASSCRRPTSWIPTGNPVGPLVSGSVTQGTQR